MGKNKGDSQSNDKRANKSIFGRLFHSKKTKYKKKKILSEVLDIQKQMSEKLTSFSCANDNLYEGLKSTSKKVELFNSHLSEIVTEKKNKDIIHDMCNQLHNTRIEEKSFTDEIKNLTNKNHQREIELCQMEAENKDLNNEISRQEKHLQKIQEKTEQLKNTLEAMKDEKLDLRLEIQKQENIVQDLKSNSAYIEATADRLSENLKEQKARIQELKEEKLKLMEYSTNKCKMYEDRLKLAWVKYTKLRQERDALFDLTHSIRKTVYNSRESGVPLTDETKVLQIELKLYRRDRLIEMLAEKLKSHEPGFSLLSDPNLVIYLDQDWYQLAVDSGSEQGGELSSVPSSTQSCNMSCESDGQEMHI